MKRKEVNEIVRKEYYRQVKAVRWWRLDTGNLLRAGKGWAASVVRYTAGMLDCQKKELKVMGGRNRQ